jgi:stage V sporulation protein G
VEITEVRIKLMEDASERLQAFCSITFDNSFVIRDLKIIDGANGPFVAMPSRKLTAHCPGCGCKNHLRAAHCNQCGGRLSDDRLVKDEEGRAKLYADIAHPINSACREMIQQRVIREFQVELDRSKLPGYKSTYDDYDHDVDLPPPSVERRAEATHRDAARSTTQVQPAEPQPRSPHKSPAQHATRHAAPPGPAQQEPSRDNFGAGIF